MAYQKQKDLIKPGGLNLALPTDLVGEDSIALHNFRTDRAGAIRSRLSTGTAVASGLLGYVHSMFTMGSERFYGATNQLYVGTTPLASPFTYSSSNHKPFGFAAFQKYLWVMTPGKNGRYVLARGWDSWNVAAPTGLGAPTAQAGGSLVDGQEYKYWVTFETADGEETNPSNEVTFTPVAGSGNNTARITHPASPDTRTTLWNVYRIGNTLDAVYRVVQLPIATATFDDYGNDDYSDLEVERLGIEMETDHDDPPAAAGLGGPYYQRLFAFCTSARPNAIFWTPPNKPYYWPADNYEPVGDESDEIVAVTMHPGHLRIYKKRSIWRLRGDFEDGILERTNEDLGLVGPCAIASAGGLDYFQTQEGIAVSDGQSVKMLTHKIEPLWRDGMSFSLNAYPQVVLHGSETERQKACMAIKNGRLYFCYIDENSAQATLVCDLETNSWHTETTPNASAGYTALYYEGQFGELLGASNGVISPLESASTSESVPLKWTAGFRDQGYRDRKKTYADLVIEHSCKRSAVDLNLTVKLALNSGDTADEALGSIPVATAAAGAERVVTTLPIGSADIGTEARNAAPLIEGNSSREVVIYSAALHYYLEPRDAVTFDSGTIDLGYTGAKEISLVWPDILPVGNVAYEIWTDLPGNAITSRATGTLTAGARLPRPIPLDYNARLFRIVLKGGPFRLYEMKVRYLPIGLYLDGSRSEVYETPNLFVAA
jgi:hypothetical protein